jgi:hypothetical protein
VLRPFVNWLTHTETPSMLRVPRREEFEGMLLLGDPGTGKTQIIHQMIAQARVRTPAEAGVVFDPACEFLRAHFDPETVVVLNPLDARLAAGGRRLYAPTRAPRGDGDQQYATAIYRISLAERLQRLGYEVEVDACTGAPEIKGFDPEYVRESSPRRLRGEGRVVELPGREARVRALVEDYCSSPEGSLVVAPAGERLGELNRRIRDALREEARLGGEERSVKVYEERAGMKGDARAEAGEYVPGRDVVRFGRSSKAFGVEAGEYARVTAADRARNLLTVATQDGREVTYSPARLSGVNVLRESECAFAEGDRVRFGMPSTGHRISAGTLGTVERLEDGGGISVRLDGGRAVEPRRRRATCARSSSRFAFSRTPIFLPYSWCSRPSSLPLSDFTSSQRLLSLNTRPPRPRRESAATFTCW